MAASESSSNAGSGTSSGSSASKRLINADADPKDDQENDFLSRRSSFEDALFGVLYTLSKREDRESRIKIRWVVLMIILDAWQLFTTVIMPKEHGWAINEKGTFWRIVSVLNFTWLGDLRYGAYLGVLYTALALLAVYLATCVWVAWCFKERKFPVMWPVKMLRIFSGVFFQAFGVASLNLLELGISCCYTCEKSRMQFKLFPTHSCTSAPHIMHAVVSAVCLVLFIATALLVNMAEVEVNLLSRRPAALGHSGAEVTAFSIKVLLTLVDVFLGWRRVVASLYLAFSIVLAWQYLRWSPHLVAWVNYLKSGVSVAIVWCSIVLLLLVFEPGVRAGEEGIWAVLMTFVMLAGLAPAFCVGALASWANIHHMTKTALWALAKARPEAPIQDVCQNLDDPRDVEIVCRCCRVWKDTYTLDPDAVARARQVVQAGVAMFPNSAYMVLLHGSFMIDVLGVKQSGGRRIEDARRLDPGLMCRFIMFMRQHLATQHATGRSAHGGATMDLLAYVEYQRKQRTVVRLHREALQAMCNFWKALDSSRVSFMNLSKALGKIESSVSQAQLAYRVVLESYNKDPKLYRLYGKFLQTVKNDPWHAYEYFAEAERLEELKSGDAGGPLLPDGTPLGRMDDMAAAVLVINAVGEIQMANRHAHILFGYRKGALEAKPITALFASHCTRRFIDKLATVVSATVLATTVDGEEDMDLIDEVLVGMRYDRLAFPIKLALRKASGVGEDSTFIVMLESVSPAPGVAYLWVAANGTIVACDDQFVSTFGWKPTEANGVGLTALVSMPAPNVISADPATDPEMGIRSKTHNPGDSAAELIKRLIAANQNNANEPPAQGLPCKIAHKYDNQLMNCSISAPDAQLGSADAAVIEVQVKLLATEPKMFLVVNRKGSIIHSSRELGDLLRDHANWYRNGAGLTTAGTGGVATEGAYDSAAGNGALTGNSLSGYTLFDFLPSPWKEMHIKYLKTTTSLSYPSRVPWGCRQPDPGSTLEFRSVSGKPVCMRISISTNDAGGELTHVVRMARSSTEAAISERRLRLSVSEAGFIKSHTAGTPTQLFGMDYSQLVGRGVWEILDWSAHSGTGRLSDTGQLMFGSLLRTALTNPGQSWRVIVLPPQKPTTSGTSELLVAARATIAKQAIMQVHIEIPSGVADEEAITPGVYVDLWPLASVTGVLDVDHTGSIRAVLEETIRPAGLLFGMPSQALVGSMLTSLVEFPAGRSSLGELLSLHGTKKSSLKTNQKDVGVKVGPVHVLQAMHVDGRPVALDVQVVGKPGPSQAAHVLLRFHSSSMGPNAGGSTLQVTVNAVGDVFTPAVRATTSGVVVMADGTVRGPVNGSFRGSFKLSTASVPAVTKAVSATSVILAALERKSPADLTLDGCAPPLKHSLSTDPVFQTATQPTASQPSDHMGPKNASALLPNQQGAAEKGEDSVVALVHMAATPPSDLLGQLADGMPVPGITPSKSPGSAVGRSRLAELVKAVEGSGRKALKAMRIAEEASSDSPSITGDFMLGAEAAAGSARQMSSRIREGMLRSPLLAAESASLLPGKPHTYVDMDVQSVADSVGYEKDKGGERRMADPGRISTWVASEGLYYQNSKYLEGNVPKVVGEQDSGPGEEVRMESTIGARAIPHPGINIDSDSGDDNDRKAFGNAAANPSTNLSPASPRREVAAAGFYLDEDAASEGGQSALSGQSGNGGAEYKRGKRFRKLMKLMDGSQTQQAEHRLRIHTIVTVGILAVVHVVCFIVLVTSIRSKRSSMLDLGRSGQAQKYMHQVMTDVRSLDVLSREATNATSNLYNKTEAYQKFFIARIANGADEIQVRMKEIMDAHQGKNTQIKDLFYYVTRTVWDGTHANGTDIYTNVTIWDFTTRFYTMAKDIEQQANAWLDDGVHIADTFAAKFLLISGPDLWRASRQILDALLYAAVDDAKMVDTMQFAFLAVEGAAITSIAAGYLAYLLRALAAQRHKLYSIFLFVPLGLTRVLASQNIVQLVDGEEDDDDDDNPGPNAAADETEDEGQGENLVSLKQKRRAMLAVMDTVEPFETGESGSLAVGGKSPIMGEGAFSPIAAAGASNGVGYGGARRRSPSKMSRLDSGGAIASIGVQRSFTMDRRKGGYWAWLARLFTRRRSSVAPLPPAATETGPVTKRKLKYDSNETVLVLMPFVLWSVLVIAIYATAVIKMTDIVQVVAIHSVCNFMSARSYRAVFYAQELAVETDPALLATRRSALLGAHKVVKDAWYTLQLGEDAYRAAGPDTERFPLVKEGLAYGSPRLSHIIYGSGQCHRRTESCPGQEYRFYYIIRMGLDSIMQSFMLNILAMASNTSSVPPGLDDDNFNFIYNVGSKDLIEGTTEVQDAHYQTIISLFDSMLVLHIILFLLFWVIFTGFLVFLLNPLLSRVSKERRRIADLISQLPLELDVEKLVARALLGTSSVAASTSIASPGGDIAVGVLSEGEGSEGMAKWKAIIRSSGNSSSAQQKPLSNSGSAADRRII